MSGVTIYLKHTEKIETTLPRVTPLNVNDNYVYTPDNFFGCCLNDPLQKPLGSSPKKLPNGLPRLIGLFHFSKIDAENTNIAIMAVVNSDQLLRGKEERKKKEERSNYGAR